MIKLADIAEANSLLVSMGGEDQMPRIAAAAVERSLELQARIERALNYASQTPANSAHARQMARILDGSITVDDELNEVPEHDRPIQHLPSRESTLAALHAAPSAPGYAPEAKRTRGPNKKKQPLTLQGRSTKQRKEMREWLAAQGFEQKQGRVPEEHIAMYDEAMEALRKARVAERRTVRQPESFPPPPPPQLSFDQ